MDLQRADARRQVQDTVEWPGARRCLQRLHQRVCAKAQIEVELQRPILDQQILVARLPIYHLYLSRAFRNKVQDRSGGARGLAAALAAHMRERRCGFR